MSFRIILQSQFDGRLQVILINSATSGADSLNVERSLGKYSAHPGKAWRIPTTIYDSSTAKLFPHHLLPHYVWIDADGEFIAATGAKDVTASNVQALLEGKRPAFQVKEDMDTERPLFSSPALGSDALQSYAVITKGHYPGLGSGMSFRQRDGKIHGYAFKNLPLREVYAFVIEKVERERVVSDKLEVIGKNGEGERVSGDDRVGAIAKKAKVAKPVIEIALKDTSDFCGPSDYNTDWYEVHARTIDFILPVKEVDHFYVRLLEYLNSYSGYVVRKEGGRWVVRDPPTP